MKRIVGYVLAVFTAVIISVVVFSLINGSGSNKVAGEDSSAGSYVMHNLGNSFITNIKDSNRYLKISIVFELRSEKNKPYYEKNNYKIRDIIIDVLRNKTEEELSAQNAQEGLKTDIKHALANYIDVADLINIYVEEFVIQ
ncbi:MAG: flagellar basal body-associated FliL family protein [Eubacteriales bacterium]|nr:flagellar basal body-associated FliL family protein [Eubacteriales bacterium]